MKIYETVGYDGLNIGDDDLILGVEYLRMLQKHSKVPFLSANIKEKRQGNRSSRLTSLKRPTG